MPRQRQYDPLAARQGLVQVFLREGYAGASLSDLESASGLNRRQLYNDFGDKQAMLRGALLDFSDTAARQFLAPLETTDLGIEAIRATLRDMTALADSPQGRLGCLVCNTARESVANETPIRTIVDDYFRRIEQAYEGALRRAVALGELPTTTDCVALARYFLGVHIALCVMSRAQESPEVLSAVCETALTTLST